MSPFRAATSIAFREMKSGWLWSNLKPDERHLDSQSGVSTSMDPFFSARAVLGRSVLLLALSARVVNRSQQTARLCLTFRRERGFLQSKFVCVWMRGIRGNGKPGLLLLCMYGSVAENMILPTPVCTTCSTQYIYTTTVRYYTDRYHIVSYIQNIRTSRLVQYNTVRKDSSLFFRDNRQHEE